MKMIFKSLKSLGYVSALALGLYGSAAAQSSDNCRLEDICNDPVFTFDFEQAGSTNQFGTDFREYNNPNGYFIGECQTYKVASNADDLNRSHWFTLSNHTPGGNNFFIGDAQCLNTSKLVWENSTPIAVDANVDYRFSAFVSNLDNGEYFFNEPEFTIEVVDFLNENIVYASTTKTITSVGIGSAGRWEELCGLFRTEMPAGVKIKISVEPTVDYPTISGADFGLDDISISTVSAVNAEIAVLGAPDRICDDENVVLQTTANPNFSYDWNFGPNANTSPTNAATQITNFNFSGDGKETITVTVTDVNTGCTATAEIELQIEDCGDYPICDATADICGDNLIDNGDFQETGNDDLYIRNHGAAEGTCGGHHKVIPDLTPFSGTDNANSKYETSADHTGNGGNFLYIDMPCIASNLEVYKQRVSINQGSSYQLSAWFSNVTREDVNGNPNNNLPSVRFLHNGNPITEFVPIVFDENNKWQQVCAPLQGLPTNDISIEVSAGVDGTKPSDIGIDDINLQAISTVDASFTVSNTTGNNEFCVGEQLSFTSEPDNAGFDHAWLFGIPGETANTNVNPVNTYLDAGTYTVTHKVVDNLTNCEDEVTMTITVVKCCEVDVELLVPDSSNPIPNCEIDFMASVTTNNSFTQIERYDWTFDDAEASGQYDRSFTVPSNQNTDLQTHTFSGPGPHPGIFVTVTTRSGNEECKSSESITPYDANCVTPLCELDAQIEVKLVNEVDGTKTFNFTDRSRTNEGRASDSRSWTVVDGTENQNQPIGPETLTHDATARPVTNDYDLIYVQLQVKGSTKEGTAQCTGSKCIVIDPNTPDSTMGTSYTVSDVDCDDLPVPPLMEGNPYEKITEGLVDESGSDNGNTSPSKQQPRLNNLNVLEEFQAYPNPSADKFDFKLVAEQKISQLIVEDMAGKTIALIDVEANGINAYKASWKPSIDIQNGMYIVRATNSTLAPIKLILKR